jgi:hypothetical protein
VKHPSSEALACRMGMNSVGDQYALGCTQNIPFWTSPVLQARRRAPCRRIGMPHLGAESRHADLLAVGGR